MGNQASMVDPVHMRIYSNMIQINDHHKRIQVIQTCLASMEYINSAKRAGVYSYLLHYISTVQTGATPALLPGERSTLERSTLERGTSEYNVSEPKQQIPRSLQTVHSYAATHPSLVKSQQQQQQPYSQHQSLTKHSDTTPSWKVITDTPKQKAMTYFSSCLEVLGIQEEVALTEETLKKAYKRMAVKAHPDKGGSEDYFEAVTRAYAYLSDILKYMNGGRNKGTESVTMNGAQNTRTAEAKQWATQDPVRLNAKNLDMNAFNKLFEETHMPDPDSDGYGDWLKSADGSNAGPKFKGEFNRDVFNRMFDDEAKRGGNKSQDLMVHPGQMALTLNPNQGVDLVGDRPSSYTAAPNSRFQFTDLRGAYTSESTISDKVSNVAVGNRSFDQYRASREKAPDPLNETELHGIQEFESRQKQADDMLGRRRAEMAVRNQQYHDQMKRMVITDGATDLNQKRLGY
jgi:curved DNA-binding protein CbpA